MNLYIVLASVSLKWRDNGLFGTMILGTGVRDRESERGRERKSKDMLSRWPS